jgi:hypothetical protein
LNAGASRTFTASVSSTSDTPYTPAPTYQLPAPPVYQVVPPSAYSVPNNQIHRTAQTLGNMTYLNCY